VILSGSHRASQYADILRTLDYRRKRERASGEHPDTLTRMNNFAFAFKFQGRNDEAISLLKTCLQLRKQVLGLGPHHPDTESSLEALVNEWPRENVMVEP
jgi:hypothetical protein